MMSELFDEQKARQQYDLSQRNQYFSQGILQGMEKGMEKGMAKGKAQNSLEIAGKLLRLGILTRQEIADTTGLPLEKINQLAASADPSSV